MIRIVITDLDNTVYNWIDYYAPSFNAMIKELVSLTGIDDRVLRGAFKRVHQKHKTSEYSFSIEELDVLSEINSRLTVGEILKKYEPAIRAFRSMRKKTLRLYNGVQETLQRLRGEKKKIVAYTDAMMFYAFRRIKQLEIEELIDGLVAVKDHGIPSGTKPEDVRFYSDPSEYETAIPFAKELDPEAVKPNPEGLLLILGHLSVNPDEAVYVGDSLYKDIKMAQICGVYDIYAEYGRLYDVNNFQQLVEITHWTDEDVARELELRTQPISPTFRISRFEEILEVIRKIEK